MNRNTRSRWQISLAGVALAAAVAIGGALAWADSPMTPANGTAPAAAPVSPANHQAAVAAFTKARDLYEKKQYAAAEAQNNEALKLEPGLADALLLKGIIHRKLAEGAGTETTGSTTESQGHAGPEKPRFLTPADIRLIKVNEWQPKADANVHGTIDRKTLETFWNDVMRKQSDSASMSKEAHDAFVAPSNFSNQVHEIQRDGETKYMDKVNFNSDPEALLVFKRTVEPYVLRNCATAACHAGDKAGNFRLYRPANEANDQTLYTNFYILAMYANADGKMIDRDHADMSLLLQYGMIKSKAVKPHPGKVEVRYFTSASDPRFVAISDWISKDLAFPRPNYGIVYELPGSAPAAQPAASTQPAAKPTK